jgi:hypothetical protein
MHSLFPAACCFRATFLAFFRLSETLCFNFSRWLVVPRLVVSIEQYRYHERVELAGLTYFYEFEALFL